LSISVENSGPAVSGLIGVAATLPFPYLGGRMNLDQHASAPRCEFPAAGTMPHHHTLFPPLRGEVDDQRRGKCVFFFFRASQTADRRDVEPQD